MAVAVLAIDEQLTDSLADDVRAWAAGLGIATFDVITTDDVEVAIARIAERVEQGWLVPLAFVELRRPEGWGQRVAIALQNDPVTAPVRTVLVTSKVSLHGVDEALTAGAVQSMLTRPWTRHGLARVLAANVATHLLEHAPERVDEFDDLVDDDARRRARIRIGQAASASTASPAPTHPLLDESTDDHALEAELVRVLDETLGHPPRLRVSPGTVLIEEGEDVGGFYVILDGSVRLSSRTDSGDHILHERSTGAIVGLLSLATHRRALLECMAVTEVRAIPITLDQLSRALAAAPELSGLLTRVLITSLARRLRRSDQLQLELDESLAELSAARAQLVAAARFATLGEMSAGLAHELNNPTAALARAAEHLVDDVAAVVDDPLVVETLRSRCHVDAEPSSTRRERRRTFTEAVGDRGLAERLVEAGASTTDDARRLAALPDAELDRLVAAAHLGDSLRNVTRATDRIQSLVGSLRAYARGDDGRGPLVAEVDVVEGIRHSLGLLAHRIRDVEVELVVDPAVPTITARPGALQQVWTNLLANALDAMNAGGRLRVTVGAVPSTGSVQRVRVEIHDDGAGVPAELLPHIFEPRFTTKDGTVRFGLGLGLSISRQLVADHDGTITVESRPGDTTFTVELPVTGPEEPGGQTGASDG